MVGSRRSSRLPSEDAAHRSWPSFPNTSEDAKLPTTWFVEGSITFSWSLPSQNPVKMRPAVARIGPQTSCPSWMTDTLPESSTR